MRFAFLALLAFAVPALAADSPLTRSKDDAWMHHERALVVLVDWSNTHHQLTRDHIEKTFFGMQPGDFSLRQWFLENSGGKFDLTGDVLDWTRVPFHWSRWNCMAHAPFGDMIDDRNVCTADIVSREVWKVLKEKGIDTSKYDSYGDGKIDHLFIIHSGRAFQNRDNPDDVFKDNAPGVAETIIFQSQGSGTVGIDTPIGFFVHEAGHYHFLLGDYYGGTFGMGAKAGYHYGKYGEGMWGIMGLGCWGTSAKMSLDDLYRYPSDYEAASKVRAGWANAQVFTQSHHVHLRPVETSADIAIVPMGTDQTESFFFEYRSNRGFSALEPGHGLLIWRGWDLMQADGRDDLNHGNALKRRPLPPNDENFGDASDPFPGSLGVTSYVDQATGLTATNITQTDDAIDFDLVFPTPDLEAKSTAAIAESVKTVNANFVPVSLNGGPFHGSITRELGDGIVIDPHNSCEL